MRKILYTTVVFVIFLLILGGIEIGLRLIPPSKSFSQLLFFNQFKISRWAFLNQRKDRLNVDWVLGEITLRNADYHESPEEGRPAFDRVPEAYHIQTNADGFRDKPFPETSLKPSVVLIGDSVGFGKGVAEQERFFSLLQQRFPETPFYNLALQACTADCMAEVLDRHIKRLRPKLVIVQTSANDIDQTLWREGVQEKIEHSPDIREIELLASSFLLQKLQEFIGRDTLSALEEHSRIADRYYAKSLNRIYAVAEQNGAQTISLNLPFAYQWNYGGHVSRACAETDNCIADIQVEFSAVKGTAGSDNFAVRTAQELHLSQEAIDLVFPDPEYFLDVVHLTELGHESVADALEPVLRQKIP